MKRSTIIACILIFFTSLANAQAPDSLSHYTMAELDTLYKQTQKSQDRLSYALALLKKGEKELDTRDTTFAEILSKVGQAYLYLRDLSNAQNYLHQATDIQKAKSPKSPAYAGSLYALGALYYYKEDRKQTEEIWLQALNLRKEILGQKHPDYASLLNSLGILYKNI